MRGIVCFLRAIYIFIKMYVRALRIFAVAFRMGGKVKGRAVALQNPKKGLKTALFMVFYNFYRFFYRFYKFFIDFIDFL